MLRFSTPVALAATGETIGQKAGIMNIGLEGLMLSSCFAAADASLRSGSAWIGLVVGMAVGILLALAMAWLVIRLGVDQVVAGTGLNLLSLGVTAALHRGAHGQSGKLLSLPMLPNVMGVDPVLLALPILVIGAGWLLFRSKWGLAARAAGESPVSVQAAGYSVHRIRFQSQALAGLLGGLAGAYLALGVTGSFAENMTAGRGFVAIAMVTFGRWKPIWAVAGSVMIGYAESLQFQFQAQQVGVPYQLLVAMPYLLALAVLIFAGKGAPAPAALGRPFGGPE